MLKTAFSQFVIAPSLSKSFSGLTIDGYLVISGYTIAGG